MQAVLDKNECLDDEGKHSNAICIKRESVDQNVKNQTWVCEDEVPGYECTCSDYELTTKKGKKSCVGMFCCYWKLSTDNSTKTMCFQNTQLDVLHLLTAQRIHTAIVIMTVKKTLGLNLNTMKKRAGQLLVSAKL